MKEIILLFSPLFAPVLYIIGLFAIVHCTVVKFWIRHLFIRGWVKKVFWYIPKCTTIGVPLSYTKTHTHTYYIETYIKYIMMTCVIYTTQNGLRLELVKESVVMTQPPFSKILHISPILDIITQPFRYCNKNHLMFLPHFRGH